MENVLMRQNLPGIIVFSVIWLFFIVLGICLSPDTGLFGVAAAGFLFAAILSPISALIAGLAGRLFMRY
jgi:hypothetical protein